MKQTSDVKAATKARLNKAIRLSQSIFLDLKLIKGDQFEGQRMKKIRQDLNEMTQCIHEFNAYNNVKGYTK